MYEIVEISDNTTVASPQHGVSQRCAVQVRAVIDFLVARKKRNIHKQLCIVFGRATVDRSTSGHWAKNEMSSETGK
jgi:hypothetical protein